MEVRRGTSEDTTKLADRAARFCTGCLAQLVERRPYGREGGRLQGQSSGVRPSAARTTGPYAPDARPQLRSVDFRHARGALRTGRSTGQPARARESGARGTSARNGSPAIPIHFAIAAV